MEVPHLAGDAPEVARDLRQFFLLQMKDSIDVGHGSEEDFEEVDLIVFVRFRTHSRTHNQALELNAVVCSPLGRMVGIDRLETGADGLVRGVVVDVGLQKRLADIWQSIVGVRMLAIGHADGVQVLEGLQVDVAAALQPVLTVLEGLARIQEHA